MKLHLSMLALTVSCIGTANVLAAGHGEGEYTVGKSIHVGGAGGWDYVTCDPATHRLFVPRGSHTQIIDLNSGQVVGDIPDTQGCHGVALAPEVGRGYVSDSHGVTVFDLTTLKPLGTIAAGQRSDAIIFDPASKDIVVMNGGSSDVSLIPSGDAVDQAKATTIPLGGRPEFAAADGKGHVYINLEDKSEVAVIDTKEKKLVDTWKIDKGEEPSGLAIDVANHRLFAGCHNQMVAVIDTESGKTIATFPIGNGVDACAFDPGTGEAFASCGDGTVTVAWESEPRKFATSTIKTPPAARTMTVDPSTHTLYLPDAEMEPATQPAAGERRRRPRPKPDTFMIVVVNRSGGA